MNINLSNYLFKIINGTIFLFSSCSYAEQIYPYSSGQAVFVQSPYNSSLYTNYKFNSYEAAPQRLPSYTTNQAVFVQQPYATTQQTVTSYPSTYRNSLPYTENRYSSPSAYPSTVAPAYVYGTANAIPSSPYVTTSQTATYRYPYQGSDYTTNYNYPYTTSTQTNPYPAPIIENIPTNDPGVNSQVYTYPRANPSSSLYNNYPANAGRGEATTTYNAYPVSTVSQYPYPTTTTANPEVIVQPAPINQNLAPYPNKN